MTDQQQIDQILDRWEAAYEQGEQMDPQALCRDCPELFDQVKRHIEALQAMDSVFQSGTTLAGGSESEKRLESSPDRLMFAHQFVNLQYHDRGGLGIVYRSKDSNLNRDVAIKVIREQPAEKEKLCDLFRLEAEITSRLEHPGVVPVHGIGQTNDGRPFYAMQFIRGETLENAIGQFHDRLDFLAVDARQIRLRELLAHFIAICKTIAYAHTRGIVHRDIKPQNIMLGKYGETLVVDWGLALPFERFERFRVQDETTLLPRTVETVDSETSRGAGTPAFMSPEQAGGSMAVGPSSDIFSLGTSLYRLLTGQLPFDGQHGFEIKQKIIDGSFDSPRKVHRWIPPALSAICQKAMAINPGDRYETALDMASDIELFLADAPVSALNENVFARIRRWTRRNRIATAMIGAGLALTAATLLTFQLLTLNWTEKSSELIGQNQTLKLQTNSARKENLKLAAQSAAQGMAHFFERRIAVIDSLSRNGALVKLIQQDEQPSDRTTQINRLLQSSFNEIAAQDSVVDLFVLNRRGSVLGRVTKDDGNPWPAESARWYKSYFHGEDVDRPSSGDDQPADVPTPVNWTVLSPVFIDPDSESRLVAISHPIRDDDVVIGLVVVSVELSSLDGELAAIGRWSDQSRSLFLVETRGRLSPAIIASFDPDLQSAAADDAGRDRKLDPGLVDSLAIDQLQSQDLHYQFVAGISGIDSGQSDVNFDSGIAPIKLASVSGRPVDCGLIVVAQQQTNDDSAISSKIQSE